VTAPVEQCDCPVVTLGGGDGFAVEVGQRRMILAERAVGLDLGPAPRRGRVRCPVDTRGPVVGEVAAEEATGAGRGRARQAEHHPTHAVAAAAGEGGPAVEGGCRPVGGGARGTPRPLAAPPPARPSTTPPTRWPRRRARKDRP